MDLDLFGDRPDPLTEKRYVRVSTALSLMSISKSKLYSLIREGRITAVKLDTTTYIDTYSVKALFTSCPRIKPKHKDVPPSRELLKALGFDAPDDASLTLSIAEDDLPLDDRMARQLSKRGGQ
ncbi:hypothetical protein ABIF38_005691 [Bradyrhizobium japonicum]|uniref:hypothetical protein n=1 Tax=Bradyrhizobium elkanii TaxID=29448 RepID=UPI0003648AD1|nr:hypothetical protein [Bradyrhizobium elkanii]MBP2434765.1 hypothetical protein [Bradyrhizobium elkanii]MCP1731999.1 hypothetical protein [Bradyrhizobium elkanii]MCS3567333.1 hypothetical protein [Bradyrhizobium elkanii]MCS3591182.1 hypothetical protein [Bradyrhizobium elkanii]MCS3620625.1 hypothetical protein [Bradyrhizobium elkanii]